MSKMTLVWADEFRRLVSEELESGGAGSTVIIKFLKYCDLKEEEYNILWEEKKRREGSD